MIALPLPSFIPRNEPLSSHACWAALAFLYDVVSALRPSVAVELGTASGNSYFALCQAVLDEQFECVCYAALSSNVDRVHIESVNATHYSSFSHLLELQDAMVQFSDASVDLLHISAVVASFSGDDIRTWLEKLKPGGILLIGGIDERQTGNYTWRIWEMIDPAYGERFALHAGAGVGVIRKQGGPRLQGALLDWTFTGSAEQHNYIRRLYVIYDGYLQNNRSKTSVHVQMVNTLTEVRAELEAYRHERMALEIDLKHAHFERDEAQREGNRLQQSLDALQETAPTKEDLLKAEIGSLSQALESERQVTHALMHSLSWRLTEPLRILIAAVRTTRKRS